MHAPLNKRILFFPGQLYKENAPPRNPDLQGRVSLRVDLCVAQGVRVDDVKLEGVAAYDQAGRFIQSRIAVSDITVPPQKEIILKLVSDEVNRVELQYRRGLITDGMFRVIRHPNYLGEIIEWIGWAIATWSLAGLAFAVWTAANLVPRARSHHQWYRESFADYPPDRKALVPRLW